MPKSVMRKRFVVTNNTCFVRLVSEGGCNLGLCLQGASQLEEFCNAAIEAYEEMLRQKAKPKKYMIKG